jgi:hypothetical protein
MESALLSQMARMEDMLARQSDIIARQAEAFALQTASIANVGRVGIESRVGIAGEGDVGPTVVSGGPTIAVGGVGPTRRMSGVGPTTIVGGVGPTGVPSGQGDRETGDETDEFVTGIAAQRSPPARGVKDKDS